MQIGTLTKIINYREAIDVADLRIEHYEWFQIYAASDQQKIL